MSLFNKFKINILPIIKLALKILGVIFSVLTIVLSFVSWDDMGISKIYIKLIILFSVVVLSFVVSLILIVFFLKTKKIWSHGNNKVTASYNDLMKIGFETNDKNCKIVVIPVNDTFDTIVETTSETISKPLVSPNTLHGMWVTKFCNKTGITVESLNERIQNNLKKNGFSPVKTYTSMEKERGNLESYDIGTVAIIDGPNNVKFYLLVVSKFDSNNNAHATKKQIRESIDDLIEFYSKKGQSDTMFIPLIGTGSSRANLTHDQSFKMLKSSITVTKINGKIDIVVYNGDQNKVSIFE